MAGLLDEKDFPRKRRRRTTGPEKLSKNRTFRVRPVMDATLAGAAMANGRSVSEEIEARLEASFVAEKYGANLWDFLEIVVGKDAFPLLIEVVGAMGGHRGWPQDAAKAALFRQNIIHLVCDATANAGLSQNERGEGSKESASA